MIRICSSGTLLHDIPALRTKPGKGYFVLEYEYDLVSGKVNMLAYQPGKQDAFYHRYFYDADNRITQVQTSTNGVVWERDAKYDYYRHGPLSRTELGDGVQAMDYAYTLQGWIKGVNSANLAKQNDIGNQSNTASTAKDEFGYVLTYNKADYKAIGTISAAPRCSRYGHRAICHKPTELVQRQYQWKADLYQ